MSERPGRTRLFLERETYQRHRRGDTARLLPVLGAGVLLVPDLLLSDPAVALGATSSWMVFFFLAWAGLIALAFALSRSLRADLDEDAAVETGFAQAREDGHGG